MRTVDLYSGVADGRQVTLWRVVAPGGIGYERTVIIDSQDGATRVTPKSWQVRAFLRAHTVRDSELEQLAEAPDVELPPPPAPPRLEEAPGG